MTTRGRVLHVLSQRPSLTGSGITLDATVRHADHAGWEQAVICGVPASDPNPEVGGLPAEHIHPLLFEVETLPAGPDGERPRGVERPLPGMSDVMPYRSTVWSTMTDEHLARYRNAWREHVGQVIAAFKPDLIHAHHVWILGAMLKDLAPDIPVFTQSHSTGLRQMELCPHLAEEVRGGVSRNDGFFALHRGQADDLRRALGVAEERIHVIGAGYREDLFSSDDETPRQAGRLIYVGKYSAAKGLPWLLDAFERLRERQPELELRIAGSGSGDEAVSLRARMEAMSGVTLLGQIDQATLADELRRASTMVLPSFYEGLPLVLVEALACGCRVVATRLPGVLDPLAAQLGDGMELVDLPRLQGPDVPVAEDLPRFVEELAAGIAASLAAPAVSVDPTPFTWRAVFRRIESVWLQA
ncbi:hypothetical protein ABI59_18645 [Acidobacteria bacterium Mor1]|nr:hypothetical protein ABI59_18645 [Acidobacteria bacterium Mor1]